MYDDFLANNNQISSKSNSLDNLDSLFNSLSNNIDNFNKYIEHVNKKKKENINEEKELMEEKLRINKSKMDFENYVKTKNQEYENKMAQVDEYLNSQKQNLSKAEKDFKINMDNSFKELEIIKSELEIQKMKFKEEQEQFETYKNLELTRIKQAQDILETEKNQFEKYKEINIKKIELENENLEQKCDKFNELIRQFNLNLKPIKEEE